MMYIFISLGSPPSLVEVGVEDVVEDSEDVVEDSEDVEDDEDTQGQVEDHGMVEEEAKFP